jgi:uncharacterized membrane protein YfcA
MTHSLAELFWLCFTAFLAGGINALAGGGTLLTFPALSGVLAYSHTRSMADVLANGTSTIALMPASIASAWGFRRETYELRSYLLWLVPPSFIGGVLGAWLLVRFPNEFSHLVPWLILTAAVLFTIQPSLGRWLASRHKRAADGLRTAVTWRSLAAMTALQLLIAIYGGYFGAGIGILMLSGLGLMGLSDMHQMNGLKSVLASVINGVAVAVFIVHGNVVWPYAALMVGTSIAGGYLAAHYSRRIPSRYVRYLVIVIGFLLAAWYFGRTYWT